MRFKRPAKVWSVDELHFLWERTCERSSQRRKLRSECLNKIIKNVPKNDIDQHIVYYTIGGRDDIYSFKISWHKDWKSYGVSRETLKFSKNKTIARNEKIEFLINTDNELAFILGQEYHDLEKMESNFHYKVGSILWEIVEDKLRDHYKEINPPSIFTIEMGDKKYYVKTDDQHRFGYLKFHLGSEYNENVIKIK